MFNIDTLKINIYFYATKTWAIAVAGTPNWYKGCHGYGVVSAA